MRHLWQIGLVSLLVVAQVYGQEKDTLPVGAVAARFVKGSTTVDSFRPIGEYRIWSFFARQTTFGRLSSAVTERREIGGQEALVLRESLNVDWTRLGLENQFLLSGESYVTPEGGFAGCDYQIGPKDSAQQLALTVEFDRLTGYYTQGGSRKEVLQTFTPRTFMWDSYLVDQLEIYLALRDLQIGTRLDDSVFLPQSLVNAHVAGQVIWFMWQEIYKGKTDSVFIIRLTEPGNYQLYFTPDKKLVRVDMIDQNIRVYQDIVRQVPTSQASRTNLPARAPFSLRLLILRLPHYVAFVIIGAAALLILAARAFRWSASYLALLAGVVAYLLMPFIVNPLLLYMAKNWLNLTGVTGGVLYFRGAILPLLTGLIQAAVLLGGLISIQRFFGIRDYRLLGAGAFLGAGFALAESIYVAGFQTSFLFEWPLLERGCMIILLTASGALIGRFLKESISGLGWAILGAVLAISVARYIPLFVQARLASLEVMHFVLTFWAIAFLVIVLVLSKKSFTRPDKGPDTEEPQVQS